MTSDPTGAAIAREDDARNCSCVDGYLDGWMKAHNNEPRIPPKRFTPLANQAWRDGYDDAMRKAS